MLIHTHITVYYDICLATVFRSTASINVPHCGSAAELDSVIFIITLVASQLETAKRHNKTIGYSNVAMVASKWHHLVNDRQTPMLQEH